MPRLTSRRRSLETWASLGRMETSVRPTSLRLDSVDEGEGEAVERSLVSPLLASEGEVASEVECEDVVECLWALAGRAASAGSPVGAVGVSARLGLRGAGSWVAAGGGARGASTSISPSSPSLESLPFSSFSRFLDSFGLCDLDDEGVSALEEASTFRRWSRKALELHSRSWHSSRLILRPPNSEWRKEILWVFLKELRVVLTEVVWVPLLAWHAGQRVPPLRTRLDLAESSARDPSSDTISTLRASGVPEPRSRKRKGCFVRRQRSSCKDRGRGRPRSCWGGVTLALPPSEP